MFIYRLGGNQLRDEIQKFATLLSIKIWSFVFPYAFRHIFSFSVAIPPRSSPLAQARVSSYRPPQKSAFGICEYRKKMVVSSEETTAYMILIRCNMCRKKFVSCITGFSFGFGWDILSHISEDLIGLVGCGKNMKGGDLGGKYY